ncbi:MAG: beta-ketoacyl synthase N-terminal-like domain-containing protein [Ardenticatenaceae bacterium]|nr:beta-ketoacyl synthase N-terminal-like domain-containing protein [Ardenticatenaceae bacterium]
MQNVYMIGIGQLPVSKYTDCLEYELAARAIELALDEAQLDREQVTMLVAGTMLSGILGHQQQLATHVADVVGLRGIEAASVDAACGSGAAAARVGYMAVAGGFHDCVAVCGVERMTHVSTCEATSGLATASDWEHEGSCGETFISLNAQLMSSYAEAYGVGPRDFAHFSINAHENGLKNANAYLKKPVDEEIYLNSRILVEPIRLMDAPPICDGAAAVVLASEPLARAALARGVPVVQITASAVGTDSLSLARRRDVLRLEGAYLSAHKAYEQADITPEEVDLFELHDAYTIITALSLEAAGFAAPGQGVHFGKDGEITLTGRLPIASMGGLKARGHPVGATGVYQLVESALQLTGRAGDNQIDEPQVALVQSIGGTGATVVTHILSNAV